VKALLTPLKGVLCGSGGGSGDTVVQVDTTERHYSCDQCDNATASIWTGERVIRNPDGSIASATPGTCKLDYFSSSLCGGGDTTCGDGYEYRNLNLQSCLVKKKAPANLGSGFTDKPIPLDLADDWQSRVNTRAFTLLTDANVAQRRQSVAVASKQKGSSPAIAELLGTAQAEFFAFNGAGHDDLWHMDWRARLVRFTFGDTSQTDTGDAGSQGIPAGGASTIADKVKGFVTNNGAAALADQFMLH
jgi:hypothetical protein